ncbi:MAG: hypothetical protein IKJ73_07170 [Lachnospiraceae bacterium]|nr:hypothetical protein [Lachnospiraceae bacterium]
MKNYIFQHEEYFSNLDYESGIVYDQVLNVGKFVKKELGEKGEKVDMCKAIQDMYDSAKEEGIEQGINQGIAKLITVLRGLGISDGQIIDELMEKYEMSREEASKRLEAFV